MDKILKCKRCYKEFIFPDKIKIEDTKLPMGEAIKLFKKRELLESKINEYRTKGRMGKVNKLLIEYNVLENVIITNSAWNSQEAYDFRGLEYPCICPTCKIYAAETHKILNSPREKTYIKK